ncbi:MAG TPA: Fic family protein [Blastocatellia bacterium]|nr:Fic family protein [Blastocatellia bacterium]
MPKPPRSLDSHVLFDRPIYDWISRVNKKHRQLAEPAPGDAERSRLNRWVEVHFVATLLNREGPAISTAEVESIVSASPDDRIPSAARNRLAALREVERLAASEGRSASLTGNLIRRLHRPLEPGEFDASETRDPKSVAARIELACRWFVADSFLQLHPVEQAAISLLRLIEIAPFADGNEGTATVAASLFTVRAGLPPLIIGPDRARAYEAALGEGLRVSTRPMVELIAEVTEQTLDEMIRLVAKG